MVQNNYQRISFLGERIKSNLASKAEKEEYMLLLYNDKLITQQQYNDFLKSSNTEELIQAGLVVGAIALIAFLLAKK